MTCISNKYKKEEEGKMNELIIGLLCMAVGYIACYAQHITEDTE